LSLLPRMTGTVPTLCLMTQLALGRWGMSLSIVVRSSSLPLRNLSWGKSGWGGGRKGEAHRGLDTRRQWKGSVKRPVTAPWGRRRSALRGRRAHRIAHRCRHCGLSRVVSSPHLCSAKSKGCQSQSLAPGSGRAPRMEGWCSLINTDTRERMGVPGMMRLTTKEKAARLCLSGFGTERAQLRARACVLPACSGQPVLNVGA
jgi:hypothetical protein